MKMYPQRDGINVAAVPRPVDLSEVGVVNKALLGNLGQVAVAVGELNPANPELPLLTMGQRRQRVGVNDGIAHAGERTADSHRLIGPQ